MAAPAQSFKELVVWQRSVKLATEIYRMTSKFPREELYGLTSQIRGSATSIASNIAEGQGRLTTGEFCQFLGIARGSTFELQTQLQIARNLDMADPIVMNEAESKSNEISKMLCALLASLRTRKALNTRH
jgi:four helix bundle protein